MTAVRCRNLVKRYGDVLAVDRLDLDVRRGECFGLLGPNGAGKTTTIEILEGLLRADSGEVEVLGMRWEHDAARLRQRLGIQLQETQLSDKLSVEEVLRLFRSFYTEGPTVERLIASVGLASKRTAWYGKLSGGQKQRLAIACALTGNPDLLFLDEPTTGLDPQSRRQVWDLLRGLKEEGRTILVTTHYMDEAERCSQIAYIYLSKLMVLGTPTELKALPEVSPAGTRRIAVATASPPGALVALKKQPFALDATLVESEIHLLMPETTGDAEVRAALEAEGLTGATLRPIEPSLEDVFVTLTRNRAKQ